jgi:cell shape-determining protein MreC
VLDIAGVNFAANKALELRTSELQKKVVEVDQLRNEVNALRAANAAMEQRLAAIEQAVKQNRPSGRARAATRRTR